MLHVIGFNVVKRHELISAAIGYFPEEEQAYHLAKKAMYGLPIAVAAAALLDGVLMFAYMKWFHLWCGIIKQESNTGGPAQSD